MEIKEYILIPKTNATIKSLKIRQYVHPFPDFGGCVKKNMARATLATKPFTEIQPYDNLLNIYRQVNGNFNN